MKLREVKYEICMGRNEKEEEEKKNNKYNKVWK